MKKPANKYRVAPKAERTDPDGVVYASKNEMIRAMELDRLHLAAGWQVTRQPIYTLGCPENVYRADFYVWVGEDDGPMYFETPTGLIVAHCWVEDVKGFRTPAFKRHVRLWRKYGTMPLVILTKQTKGWKREVILPGSKPTREPRRPKVTP